MTEFTADHDPYTFRYLSALGVGPGWHCADVGAGGGSVARWLRDQVASNGRVVAVDLDEPRLRDELRDTDVEISGDDVRTQPLPAERFDLVHTRLMLSTSQTATTSSVGW